MIMVMWGPKSQGAGKDKTHTLLGEDCQRQKEQVEKGKANDRTALFDV